MVVLIIEELGGIPMLSSYISLLLVSILPIILILFFIYQKDKNKESIRLLLLLFLCGIISCFLVISISNTLKPIFPFFNWNYSSHSVITTFLYTFLGVALIEEICKWVMVYGIGYYHKEFEELYDITVYAVFVSLGFACYENIAYVFHIGELKTALLRAVSAVPAHACDAVFMGYYLSLAKTFCFRKNKKLEKKNIFLSIFVPVVLHGVYDFCLLMNYRIFLRLFFVFMIYLYIHTYQKINKMAEENVRIKPEILYCRNCGEKLNNSYCINCKIEYKEKE